MDKALFVKDWLELLDRHDIPHSVLVYRDGNVLSVTGAGSTPADCRIATLLGKLVGRLVGDPEVQQAVAAVGEEVDAGIDDQLASLLGIHWWYVSFADEQQFLGGCIVEAKHPSEAVKICRGLNLGLPADADSVSIPIVNLATLPDERWRNRLLSKDDMMEAGMIGPEPEETEESTGGVLRNV